MNSKALKTLEYDKIIAMLVKCATCDPGRKLCSELLPSSDIDEIDRMQAETEDACNRIRMKGRISFGDVRNLGDSLKRLDIGASLSMPELLYIGALLNNTSRAISYGYHEQYSPSDSTGYTPDSLDGYFSMLDAVPTLAREINRCIVSEDEMADDASAELKTIRRQLKLIADRMHSELNSILNSHREYLMDPIIAIRDGSYCLPVRTECRNMVPGIIHDQSSTGSTIFIEPMAVIRLNNDIRELEAKEKTEISRILDELSEKAIPCAAAIESDMQLMAHLDFVFAKALLASSMNATRPSVNDGGIIDLIDARHPLIEKSNVVPINIKLGDTYDLLVITGPNTGGKTVSLKTAGLLSVMSQAGLHIPAFQKSRTAVFTEIFADIGDEQSIEQSLSTFSGHMKNIVDILEKADSYSLCLFDELGAGTDPVEGAALAISILSFLHNMKVRTIATTHYSELKIFALTTDGVENAGCEFDIATLRPTYRLLTGIPGKSNAFSISGKLGLPQFIIDDAGKRIGKNEAVFEDLIADLNRQRAIIEQERKETESAKAEIEKLKKRHETQDQNLDARKEDILRKAREEARDILAQAKETADDTIRNINKIAQDSGLGKALEKERERLRKELKDVESGMGIKAKPVRSSENGKPPVLHKGDRVHVISLGTDGTVSTTPNEKGMFFVQMGILRSQVNINDVYPLEETPASVPSKHSGSYSGGMKSLNISREINLIGKNVDEACAELDKYLDDALLAHMSQVRIIHGRGTGALKSGIHSYLKKQKFIKKYHLADFDDGGEAITIVEFR